jgi:hypothetical protein
MKNETEDSKEMEIFSGYPKEMETFFWDNCALKDRNHLSV